MNDRSATGARKAFLEVNKSNSQQPLYCGIDGLPGKDGGIRLVRDSILEASYIYPTYGDRLLQLAIDILDGKPYQKEIQMQSALVTHDNANVLLMQTDETLRQGAYLEQLHEKADNYLHKLDTQRAITWLACGVIVLLLVVIVLLYLYYLGKVNMRRERVVNTLWNLKSEDIATEELTTGSQQQKADGKEPTANGRQLIVGSEETTADNQEATADSQETTGDNPEPSTSYFIARFKEVVEASLENSELSVEDLAASMNLSRVQLYRKVKNITGSTPVELLRTARLNRSYQLLLTTDRSVSEIAYQVGFTAPSYFTKCFKEAYGMLPGEVRTQ
jgi:AraC-like DNA-binding protein